LGFIGPLVVLDFLVFWPIVYKPLWKHFVFKFEFLWNSEFSLKSRCSPYNYWSFSLNLWFKVTDLFHLSWNLLQESWFPHVPQTCQNHRPPIFLPIYSKFIFLITSTTSIKINTKFNITITIKRNYTYIKEYSSLFDILELINN